MKLKMSANVNYRADMGLKLAQCFSLKLYNYTIPTSAVTLKTASSLSSNKSVVLFCSKTKEKQEMLAVCETDVTAAQRNQLDLTSYFTSLIY